MNLVETLAKERGPVVDLDGSGRAEARDEVVDQSRGDSTSIIVVDGSRDSKGAAMTTYELFPGLCGPRKATCYRLDSAGHCASMRKTADHLAAVLQRSG